MKINEQIKVGDFLCVTCQGLTVTGQVSQVECYAVEPGLWDLVSLTLVNDTTKLPHYWKPDVDGGSYVFNYQADRPFDFTVYYGETDNVPVVHVGTGNLPENERGPICRVYLNDAVLYENPALSGESSEEAPLTLGPMPAGKVGQAFFEIGEYDEGRGVYAYEGFTDLLLGSDGAVYARIDTTVDSIPDLPESQTLLKRVEQALLTGDDLPIKTAADLYQVLADLYKREPRKLSYFVSTHAKPGQKRLPLPFQCNLGGFLGWADAYPEAFAYWLDQVKFYLEN